MYSKYFYKIKRQIPADLSPDKEMSKAFVTDWQRFILVVSPRSGDGVSGTNLKADACLT